ncbi:MAG: Na+/H+ antiporter subunit E [Defluviitaleaceae bacterium]|nr:Na+/H+ antiporter subunit E [Defluviitaleaceae bacterium]
MRKIFLMTAIWIILNGFSYANVAIGIIVGAASLWLAKKFMKPSEITGVSFFRLVFYPFFLLWQVYVAGFMVIGMIIRGCYTEVVTAETEIRNDFLRAMLCNTITMIPGSVVLDRDESKIKVMLLKKKNSPPLTENISETVMGKPEKKLLKAERGV